MAKEIAHPTEERVAYLDALVERASVAAAVFTQYSQSDVDRIVKPMVIAGLENAQTLARLAVEETRLGVLEDKAIKNMVATEFVYNYVKDKRTVGVIREVPEKNLAEVAEPIGVILSVLPITNPTSTVLFKCIMAVKTRNCMIFSAHPRASRCSYEAARVMSETAVKHGAPEGFITWIDEPTLADTHYLMRHPAVRMIDATGGPLMVEAAYSSGKPALGVGPGNTPVYLEKSADLDMAVVDVITSKTFDNGTICASEQTVVIDEEVYDAALARFAELGCHICTEDEVALLSRTVIDPQTGTMHPRAVGQRAVDIAKVIGMRVAPHTKLLVAPIRGVGRDHPLSAEKLFPVLAVIPARSTHEALKLCMDVIHYGGLGHTAVVFSNDDAVIAKFGETINAGRIIVNSPGSVGALGGVYNDLVPTFSFGCGTGGGNCTIDNVNVYHYLNVKRMARRTQAHMWFRVPNQIYFNKNAVENLREFPSSATVIVTQPDAREARLRRRRPPPPAAGHPRPRADRPRPRTRPHHRAARRPGAQRLQRRPDRGPRRRVGDRRGQDHEAALRIARGGPRRAVGAVSRPPQAGGRVPVGRRPHQPRPAHRHLDDQRHRDRGHAVRRHARRRRPPQDHPRRLLAGPRRRDRRSAVRHVDAAGDHRRHRRRLPGPRPRGRGVRLRLGVHRLAAHCRRSGSSSSTCRSPSSIQPTRRRAPRCTTPRASPGSRSPTPRSASTTPSRTRSAPASPSRTVGRMP